MNLATNLEPPRSECWKVGDVCILDHHIEPGLFEDDDGNRYLILSGDEKLVIVLQHESLPRFTCLPLGSVNLGLGRWWGRPRLRLSHALRNTPSRSRFGTIAVSEGHVELCVRSINGDINWFIVALVADPRLDCHFNGWILDAADVSFAFFERTPNGRYSLGKLDREPGFHTEIYAEIMHMQFVSLMAKN